MALVQRKGPKRSNNNSNGNVAKIVKNILAQNQELKFFQVITTSAAVDYDGTLQSKSNMAQGDTVQTRDGDRIHIKSFHMKWDILANTLVALFRIIVFQWHTSTNQLAPTIGQILNLPGGQAEAIHSQYNPEYHEGGSFTVLYDKVMQVDTNGTIGQGICMRTGSINVKSGFRPNSQFVAGATTGFNQIYTLVLSDRVTTNLPLFRSVSFLRFTDA